MSKRTRKDQQRSAALSSALEPAGSLEHSRALSSARQHPAAPGSCSGCWAGSWSTRQPGGIDG